MTLVPDWQRQTRIVFTVARRSGRLSARDRKRKKSSAAVPSDRRVCVRVYLYPRSCRRERFRVFPRQEIIHEREKKRIYALRITWCNSGPRIANSASRYGINAKRDQTNVREGTRNAKSGNQKVYERAFEVEILKTNNKQKETRFPRSSGA